MERFGSAVAIVTGGGGGIGAAICERLASEGAHAVVCDVNKGPADVVATGLRDRGLRAETRAVDITSRDACTQLVDDVAATHGRIDVLVNNAGAWIASPLTDDGWADGWRDNLALNLQAPADLCRYAIEHFRIHGGGAIVNVASRSSHRGDDAEHLAYGAAKGGLLALTRGIARGYAHENILAYAVAPSWVATDLSADAVDAEAVAALPLGEPVPPQDVAETIVFLASGRARHATGTTVDITGAD